MILRPDADLPHRLVAARKTFRLTLAQMAAELRIRPEWLSKITNGHQPPSCNIGLRLDEFLRRRGADPATFARGNPGAVSENEDACLPAENLPNQIDRQFRQLLAKAGNDVARLTWLNEQLQRLAQSGPNAEARIPAGMKLPTRAIPKPLQSAQHRPDSDAADAAPRRAEGPARGDRDRRELLAARYRALAEE